jgi:transposase-like protein
MTTQELSGDDVKCDKCQSIFDCRNEPSLCYGNESRWICGNCSTTYTDEELMATFEEED